MDGGPNGLTGPNHHLASKAAEQETRPERDRVATHHRPTMVETVSRKDRCRGRLSVSTVATTSSLTTTSRLSSMETLRTSKYLSMIMRFYSSQGKSIKIHFHGQRNLSVQ